MAVFLSELWFRLFLWVWTRGWKPQYHWSWSLKSWSLLLKEKEMLVFQKIESKFVCLSAVLNGEWNQRTYFARGAKYKHMYHIVFLYSCEELNVLGRREKYIQMLKFSSLFGSTEWRHEMGHVISLCLAASCCVNTGGVNRLVFGAGTRLTIATSKSNKSVNVYLVESKHVCKRT